MSMSIRGKTAFVSGAGRNIGRAAIASAAAVSARYSANAVYLTLGEPFALAAFERTCTTAVSSANIFVQPSR